MTDTKYGKYIVTELKTPKFNPEFVEKYTKFAKRILWMDDQVVEGAFQMNCSWYLKPNDEHMAKAHVHPTDEIIGFFSSDPEDPYNLDSEIEFWMEDEMHIITKSCMIFVPAGMKHLPLILRRVGKPIFHFTTVNGGQYIPKPA